MSLGRDISLSAQGYIPASDMNIPGHYTLHFRVSVYLIKDHLQNIRGYFMGISLSFSLPKYPHRFTGL